MFDLTALQAHWAKLVAYQAPVAEEELFNAKLSRVGVKAPYGTPAAKMQLAKALAKAAVVNGGSGNFMGEPVDGQGNSNAAIKAKILVGTNMPYAKADYIADKAVGQ